MKTEKQVSLDDTDIQILANLQNNCRQSISELAEKVHLSTSACHRRIKSLEDVGVVTGYVAKLSPQKLGFRAEFFVELSLATQGEEAFENFEKALRQIPEVLECYLVGGQYDYLLRIVAQDTEDYERIHRQSLSRLPGVTRIQSILSLRTVKPNLGLPIG
jgi:Lrp/AsnC family transcriptional regulator, leucine-responsive regulatory protein